MKSLQHKINQHKKKKGGLVEQMRNENPPINFDTKAVVDTWVKCKTNGRVSERQFTKLVGGQKDSPMKSKMIFRHFAFKTCSTSWGSNGNSVEFVWGGEFEHIQRLLLSTRAKEIRTTREGPLGREPLLLCLQAIFEPSFFAESHLHQVGFVTMQFLWRKGI